MQIFLKQLIWISMIFLLALSVTGQLVAAEANSAHLEELSLDAIALEISNPATSLASFDIDVEYRSFQGDLAGADNQSTFIYNFQPSLPIPLDNGRNILLRASIPIWGNQPLYYVDRVEYPEYRVRQLADVLPQDRGFRDGHDHLADIELNVAYGGVNENGLISKYGFALVLPTSADISSSIDQYQLGPEVAFGKLTSWGLFGVNAKHLTRVSGDNVYDTNMSSVELFFAYGLGNGWQLFSNPVIEYDWEAVSDNQLFLPLGGGVSRTLRVGGLPLKLSAELQYYLVSPESFGQQWLLTFSMTPVWNNPFKD
jgi:hypothetical protein